MITKKIVLPIFIFVLTSIPPFHLGAHIGPAWVSNFSLNENNQVQSVSGNFGFLFPDIAPQSLIWAAEELLPAPPQWHYYSPLHGYTVGSSFGIYRTKNNGCTWENIEGPLGEFSTKEFWQETDSKIWTVTANSLISNNSYNGIWLSEDQGLSWRIKDLFTQNNEYHGIVENLGIFSILAKNNNENWYIEQYDYINSAVLPNMALPIDLQNLPLLKLLYVNNNKFFFFHQSNNTPLLSIVDFNGRLLAQQQFTTQSFTDIENFVIYENKFILNTFPTSLAFSGDITQIDAILQNNNNNNNNNVQLINIFQQINFNEQITCLKVIDNTLYTCGFNQNALNSEQGWITQRNKDLKIENKIILPEYLCFNSCSEIENNAFNPQSWIPLAENLGESINQVTDFKFQGGECKSTHKIKNEQEEIFADLAYEISGSGCQSYSITLWVFLSMIIK